MLPVSAENTEESVVPHAGTWIEIILKFSKRESKKSFPTRERGLKYHCIIMIQQSSVVPHAGTWIEILTYDTIARRFQSFPTRERGLKCKINIGDKDWEASFPTRERGLKSPVFHPALFHHRRSPRGNVD